MVEILESLSRTTWPNLYVMLVTMYLLYKLVKISPGETFATICIIGGGNSRKLPVSVKGVNSFTCPMIYIETIGGKRKYSI